MSLDSFFSLLFFSFFLASTVAFIVFVHICLLYVLNEIEIFVMCVSRIILKLTINSFQESMLKQN